jgi:regulator of protease activity HflC (stomatin/prohibitin superfamily)
MRVVDIQAADLASLPRFQHARTTLRLLTNSAWALLIVSLLLLLVLWRMPMTAWSPLVSVNAAMLLLLLAGVMATRSVVYWRAMAMTTALTDVTDVAQAGASQTEATPASRMSRVWLHLQRLLSRLQFLTRLISAEGWTAIIVGCLSLLALVGLFNAWNWQQQPAAPTTLTWVIVGVTLTWSFALLVLERYATLAAMPEAVSLSRLLRVALTVTLLSAMCLLLVNSSRSWPLRVAVLVSVLPGVLALELLLRALLSAFTPPAPQSEPELLVNSLFAGLWCWPLRPLYNLRNELQQRFGIDLRQSWAFAYIRRSLLTVCGVILLCAWLLTAVTQIATDARGIHERFGKPVAVWSPGLHVGLPWPMSRLRLVENGVVHELATASASDADAAPTIETTSAEGPPPESANRLWDASHVAEKSQVIASRADERQSFHIVNMDVRFIYRIGLSDAAAIAATYNSSDLPTLIRSTANRVLVRYFSSRTLEGVLGDRRVQLAIDIGKQVQRDLDALDSGVQILATVVEAIHPPAAAAYAYHSVQAAQISVQAMIARERGVAAEQVNLAQLRAGMATSAATASAREAVATAQVAQRRFAAEREAHSRAGKAFLFEQYLSQLSQGLSSAQLTVVDHHLRGAATTVDLRSFALGNVATALKVEQ